MGVSAVLRKDLSITEVHKEDGTIYQVVDPVSDESFEFGDKEWFLLSRLGDSVPPADLIDEFKRKFQTEITLDQLDSLVDLVKKWGLCQDSEDKDRARANVIDIPIQSENVDYYSNASTKSSDRPFRGGRPGIGKRDLRSPEERASRTARMVEEAFKDTELTWTCCNPNQVFLTMSRILSPLRYVVYVLPLMLLIGVLVVFNNLPELIHDHRQFRAPLSILQILVSSMFTVNLITQVGRGIVCRGYGMDVDGFGIMLVLGILPRFGVHTSGISQLERRQQLWVHMAPLLIRLTLFSCGILLWIMARSNGTHIASLGLMIATVSIASFILSAHPLVNSSGYKYLATLLDMPNLRRKAYRALFAKRNNDESTQGSEENMFALKAYALASVAFWVLLLGAVGVLGARWLESNFQGVGVVIFLLLSLYFVIRLRGQLKKRKSKMKRAFEDRLGGRARGKLQQRLREQAEVEPELIQGVEENNPDRKKRPWLKYAVILVLLVIAFLPYSYETGGEFTIMPVKQEWIYAETSGIVEEVFHNGNEFLPAGTLLATLSSVEQEQNIQTTAAAILEQKAELELLLTTPTKEDLDLAQRKLDTVRVQLKYSRDSEKRLKKLFESGNISYEDYEDERRKKDVYSMEVEEAKAYLAKVKAGPNPQEIEAARSELVRLEEKQRFQQMELEMTRLVMPIEGYLVTRNLNAKVGQYIDKGDMFAVVEDGNSVRVDIKVPEADISDVKTGATVRLKAWSYPQRIFEGKVSEIDRTVSDGSFGEVVVVSAIIPNADGLLQTGMTGFGKVDGGTKFVIVAFSRMLVRFFLIELWSWIP